MAACSRGSAFHPSLVTLADGPLGNSAQRFWAHDLSRVTRRVIGPAPQHVTLSRWEHVLWDVRIANPVSQVASEN